MDPSEFEKNDQPPINTTTIQPATKTQVGSIMVDAFDKNGSINKEYYNDKQVQIDAFKKSAANGHNQPIKVIDQLGLRITGFDKHQKIKQELINVIEELYRQSRDVGVKTEQDLKSELKLYHSDIFNNNGKKRFGEIAKTIIDKNTKVDRKSLEICLKLMAVTCMEIIRNPLDKNERKTGLTNINVRILLYILFGIIFERSQQIRSITTNFKRLYHVYSLTDDERKVLTNKKHDKFGQLNEHYKKLQKYSQISGNAFIKLTNKKLLDILSKCSRLDILPESKPSNTKITKRENKRKSFKSPDESPMKTNEKKRIKLNDESEAKSEEISTNKSSYIKSSTKSSSICLPGISPNYNTVQIAGNKIFLSDKFSMNVDGLWSVDLGIFGVIIQTGISSKKINCEIEKWLPHEPRIYFKLNIEKGNIDTNIIEELLNDEACKQLDLSPKSELDAFEILPSIQNQTFGIVYNEIFRESLMEPIFVSSPNGGHIAFWHKVIPDEKIKLNNSLCSEMIINSGKTHKHLQWNKQFNNIDSNRKSFCTLKKRIERLEPYEYFQNEFAQSITPPPIDMTTAEVDAYWKEMYELCDDNTKTFISKSKSIDDAKKTEEYRTQQLELFNLTENGYKDLGAKLELYEKRRRCFINDLPIDICYREVTEYECNSCGKIIKLKKCETVLLLGNMYCDPCKPKIYKLQNNKDLTKFDVNKVNIGQSLIVLYPKAKKK
eukprot:526495_1